MRNLIKYFTVAGLMFFMGCGEDEKPAGKSDREYFPLRKGFYQIYAVNGTNYPRLNVTEPFSYELKTEVVDSFANDGGGYTYTMHHSTRQTEDQPWEFQRVWSVRVSTANLIVSEENTAFVKLVFPTLLNRTWDGNAYNTLPEDQYEIMETGTSFQVPDGAWVEDYARIVQENFVNLVRRDQREEVYSRGIGLVYRKSVVIEYCSDVCEITDQIIDNGTVYVQVLKSYGQN